MADITFKGTANSGLKNNATSSVSFSYNNTGEAIIAIITACEDQPYVNVDTSTKPRFGTSGGDANDGFFTFRARQTNAGGNTGWVEFWHLKNAPQGNLTFTLQLTGNVNYSWQVTLLSFDNVDASNIWDAAEGNEVATSDTPNASVSTVTDRAYLVSGYVSYNTGSFTFPGAPQVDDTYIADAGNGTDHVVSHKGPKTPAGSDSISYMLGSAVLHVMMVGALRPGSGGGGGGTDPNRARVKFVAQQGIRKTKSNDRSDRTGGARR